MDRELDEISDGGRAESGIPRVVTLVCCREAGGGGPRTFPQLFGGKGGCSWGALSHGSSEDPHACPPPGKWARGQGSDSRLLLP